MRNIEGKFKERIIEKQHQIEIMNRNLTNIREIKKKLDNGINNFQSKLINYNKEKNLILNKISDNEDLKYNQVYLINQHKSEMQTVNDEMKGYEELFQELNQINEEKRGSKNLKLRKIYELKNALKSIEFMKSQEFVSYNKLKEEIDNFDYSIQQENEKVNFI